MTQELRERVARACAYAVEMQHSTLDVVKTLGFSTIEAFVDKAWPNYLPQADAAITIVLEEAARVVRRMPSPSSEWMADELLRALGGSANPVAAAIRALKEGK